MCLVDGALRHAVDVVQLAQISRDERRFGRRGAAPTPALAAQQQHAERRQAVGRGLRGAGARPAEEQPPEGRRCADVRAGVLLDRRVQVRDDLRTPLEDERGALDQGPEPMVARLYASPLSNL